MSDGGKGSKARPLSVNLDTFDDNWDRIFSQPDTRAIGDKVLKQVEEHIEKSKKTDQRD